MIYIYVSVCIYVSHQIVKRLFEKEHEHCSLT